MAKLPRSWHSPLSGSAYTLSVGAVADAALVADVGLMRSNTKVEEAAMADARIDVGEASRGVDVEVGSKPGGGSISCLVAMVVGILKRLEGI